MPTRASTVKITGNWNVMPKAKISVIISERYSETRGKSEIAACPSPPACCMLRKKRIASGIATKYTNEAPSKKQNGVAIRYGRKAGRDEHINLRRDHRERQECRTEQAELDLREQEFLRRGVDQLDLGVRARGKLIRKKKNVVDLLRKEEAEEKHQEERNQRLDEPRAQLDQMLDQRRLAGVDFIIFGGHAPRSGSDFGLPAPAALSGLPGSAMLNGSSTAFRISSPVFFTSSSAVPAVASFKSFSASFFISASSISRMALENWFWKSLASLLSFPRFCATARTTPGSSFGPITTSATMPITRSSLQPMSNMALVSAGAKRRSARGERRVSSPFSRTRSAWRMKAGGRSFSDHCYGYRRRPCLPRTTLS